MNLSPEVIYIVVAAIAGYLLGILDSRFSAFLRKNKKTEVKVANVEPVTTDTDRTAERTVLRVNVDKERKWHVDLDGQRLPDAGSITQDQRQKIVNTLVRIRPWLDTKPTSEAPAPQTSLPVNTTAAAPGPLAERPEALPIDPSPTFSQPAYKDTSKLDPVRGFGSMLTNDVKAKVGKPPASIVTMIDAVLQIKLSGSPLANKGIRLEDGPMGSVIVWVGSQRYDGIGEVPQPEIREILKESIAEWERK